MVTLLPAHEGDDGGGGKSNHRIRIALNAPPDAKKVKVKAKFTFPSRKPKGGDNDDAKSVGGG